MLVAYSAMSNGNLKAVDQVIKVVRELDRYHGFGAIPIPQSFAEAPVTPPPLALLEPPAAEPAMDWDESEPLRRAEGRHPRRGLKALALSLDYGPKVRQWCDKAVRSGRRFSASKLLGSLQEVGNEFRLGTKTSGLHVLDEPKNGHD